MAIRIVVCLSLLIFWLQPQAIPQDAASPSTSQITFKFERSIPGVAVPRYTLDIRQDGTGLYQADVATSQSSEPQKVERPLVVTPGAIKTIFALLDTLQSSNAPCASKLKNIADTGTKTLTYRDPRGSGSCTYNYSENKAVAQLTDFFQAVEFTLEEGRNLEFKHRFDRLGLDTEISSLAAAVENGRARELGTIAPTLRSIAADTELIERVRLRAARLLESGQVGQ